MDASYDQGIVKYTFGPGLDAALVVEFFFFLKYCGGPIDEDSALARRAMADVG